MHGHGAQDVDADQGDGAESGGSAETFEKGLKSIDAANDLIVFFHIVVIRVITEEKLVSFVLG